ncbi:MAG: alpha-L-fucosidase [Clostridia bacterium]|nr:alpha-L-fucosidase [Clostridia bacterium]
MWYQDRYRRHLCDMHIEDWSEKFLSEFSPEEYVENLKRAKINNAMLYYQSHVGLCYFPTKVGVVHKAFIGREHLMRDLVDLCHKNDIRVTGYYSLNYNTAEHDRHPEWRMITQSGISRRCSGERDDHEPSFASLKARRYGFCCPNNMEYRAFVFEQIDEMMDYFDSDALFFDMPFWPHTCCCEKCRARWAKEVGGEMPVSPAPDTKEYALLTERKYAWMGEWVTAVTAHVKAKNPDMPVEHNYASGISSTSDNGCGEEVCLASDYAGGDLYGGAAEHSFTCKFYRNATRNQPFEYMFSRCKPALRVHTLTKSAVEMKNAVAITAAHHGATLVIDAIDPVGTMDRRVYDRIGDMFDYQAPYEPYFRGDMIEDVGIYYGIRSKTSFYGDAYNGKSCSVCAAGTLARNHIPFGVTGSYHDVMRYPVLIAPMLSQMEEKDNDRLISYVEKGGTLYISGGGNRALVETLTGGRLTGVTPSDKIYLAPTEAWQEHFGWFNPKYPLPFEGLAPVIEGIDAENVAATLTLPYTNGADAAYASIHSDPPGIPTGIPMIVVRKYGKGTVIWSAAPIEGVAYAEYREIFLKLLMTVSGINEFSMESDAPADVEMTLFRDGREFLVNAVTVCGEDAPTMRNGFSVRVRTSEKPERVELLPDRTTVEFTFEDGFTAFRTRDLNIFDMYRILLPERA